MFTSISFNINGYEKARIFGCLAEILFWAMIGMECAFVVWSSLKLMWLMANWGFISSFSFLRLVLLPETSPTKEPSEVLPNFVIPDL